MSRDDELRAKLTLSNLKCVCFNYGILGVSGNWRKEPYANVLASLIEARPFSLHKSPRDTRVIICGPFLFLLNDFPLPRRCPFAKFEDKPRNGCSWSV